MKIYQIVISIGLLLVAFQNCEVPDADVENTGIGKGDINCMAFPVPYMRLGFDFTSSAASNGEVPEKLELIINNEVVYSSCNGNNVAMLHIENNKAEMRIVFGENVEEAYPYLDLRLNKLSSCFGGETVELLSIFETPNYQTYSMCGVNSYKYEVDYLIN